MVTKILEHVRKYPKSSQKSTFFIEK